MTRVSNSICVFWRALVILLLWASSPAHAASYSYSNTDAATIPDIGGGVACSLPLDIDFTVSDSFTVDDLDVGLLVQAAQRADLAVYVFSPMGTVVELANAAGGNSDDFNVRFDDEAATPIGSTSHDHVAPYPEFERQPTGNLSDFDGEAANGTWTVRVCQVDNGADTYYRSDLYFEGSPSADPLVVTSTADTNTLGTLRFAINHANTNPADDDITFNIAGTGPHVITLGPNSLEITDAGVKVDGLFQSGSQCNAVNQGVPHSLNIELVSDGNSTSAFVINAADVDIRGLSITGFPAYAIKTSAAASPRARIACNYLGIRADNSTSGANGFNNGYVIAADSVDVIIQDNIISGNSGSVYAGIILSGTLNATITGNVIGLLPDGNSPAGNGIHGIFEFAGTNTTIGGVSASERNIISSNSENGIYLVSSSGTSVIGNYIGTNNSATLARENQYTGVYLVDSTNVEIGRVNAGNVLSSPSLYSTVWSSGSTTGVIIGNYMGVAPNGTMALGTPYSGVYSNGTAAITIGDGTTVGANIIRNGVYGGIVIDGDSKVAALANSIYDNSGIGIEILSPGFGVTPNDSGGGDGDSGPNELLNFPVINSFSGNGVTALSYDFNLDVPSVGNGYRIDFYKNSAADPSGHGEGETHLGFVDVAHAGGDLNFTGSFTASETVSVGNIISATATRKTGASSYDITSEFSLNYSTSGLTTELVVSDDVNVFDPLAEGLYFHPGNDIIRSLNIANTGGAPTSSDSVVLIVNVADDVIFYNGDVDDGGPETNAVAFDQSAGGGLSFTYGTDVAFSNMTTKPSVMGDCNYTPSSGYDSAVTFICLNPKGQLMNGDPDPFVEMFYRSKIR